MLNALVSMLDRTLRARDGIFEYSDHPHCIFRAQLAATASDIALSDDTRLAAGSRLINLHLWNEHVPRFPAEGPTLGWARRVCRDIEASLEELAAFVAKRPALDDIAAIGGKMTFGSSEQRHLVVHLAERYGFVRAVDPARGHSIADTLHLVGESILISLIVISYNPAAFRTDRFRHNPIPVYLRRTELMRRFGAREEIAPGIYPTTGRQFQASAPSQTIASSRRSGPP